jgi:hypothetical protein
MTDINISSVPAGMPALGCCSGLEKLGTALPPVGLWYVHPPRRLRPVGAPVDTSMEILEVVLQVQPVVRPRHAVHPGRGLRLKREVRGPQMTKSTWCSSAVNRASLSVRAIRRTRPSSLGAPCPALGPGRVSLAAFPLAGRLPSTASAAPPWALFGSFTGNTRPSDFSRSSITGLRPLAFPVRPAPGPSARVPQLVGIFGPIRASEWRG